MAHANRKPKGRAGGTEIATGPAQFYGVYQPIRRECAVRMVLARGILMVLMLGAAGPPICDSGSAAMAEEGRPQPKSYPDDTGLVPIAAEHEMVQRRYERLIRELERQEERRKPQRGDFWTQDEIKRLSDPPATFGR
jgi:hypothetical protein